MSTTGFDVMVNSLTGGVTGYASLQFDNSDFTLSASSISMTAQNILLTGTVFTDQLSTYLVNIGDYSIEQSGVYLIDASDTDVLVKLPNVNMERIALHIKRIDSSIHTVTIEALDDALIDGELSYTLAVQYAAVSFVSNGASFYIISSHSP